MKVFINGLLILCILINGISVISCKQDAKNKMDNAGESVLESVDDTVEKLGESGEKAGEALDNGVREVEDAMVKGTVFNATGMVPCLMGNGRNRENCEFGVKREGNGSGMVTITKPDGNTRTIFFKDGQATGYDSNQADLREFKVSKKGDMYIVDIGEERYEIPEAVIYGG